jgi:hypothetical protein
MRKGSFNLTEQRIYSVHVKLKDFGSIFTIENQTMAPNIVKQPFCRAVCVFAELIG